MLNLLNYFAAKEKFPLGRVAYRNKPLALVGGSDCGESAVEPAVCAPSTRWYGAAWPPPQVAATPLCPVHLCTYPCGRHVPLLALCVSDEEDEKIFSENCLLWTSVREIPLPGKNFGIWPCCDSRRGTCNMHPGCRKHKPPFTNKRPNTFF